MAVVKNITPDARSLFSADAPPAEPGDSVTISDARFVDRAWPKSTWELVEPPKLEGYTDQSVEDAYLWAVPPAYIDEWATDHPFSGGRMDDPSAFPVSQVLEYLANVDDEEVERVQTAEAARGEKARKTVLEWSKS